MADFTDPFDSLAAWDFGTSLTTELALAAATPSPYLGGSRGAQRQDVQWAAAQYDLVDGGDPDTTYWISYAFYIPDWADIDAASADALLPGFINENVDPLDALTFTGTAGAFQPYLTATSASTGTISSYYGTGDAVSDGAWHTVRYGLKLDGATSHETMYLDDVLVEDSDYNLSDPSEDHGLFGIIVGGFAQSGPTYSIAIDSAMYSPTGDPGEPTEPAAPAIPGTGVWIAGSDGLFDEPITDPQRLDELYKVNGIKIKRGRQDEFADVPTGECEISFVDTGGTFDPAPFDSKQAGVAIRNPVTDTWHDLFRGFLNEPVIEISPSQVKRDVTLQLVDWLDYFARVEMQPGFFGDTPPAGSERYVFYEDGPVDDRIIQLLADTNFNPDLTRIFTGNISVLESVYSPGETILSAIDECCEAEFPGVAIRYVSKGGVFTFHGRLARFRPDIVDFDIGDWECGDGVAVHASGFTRAQIRPPLIGRRPKDAIINRSLIYPRGSTDTEIAGVVVEDTASQTAHGIHPYTVPDLIIDQSFLSSLPGIDECEMYAQHFVDSFSEPQTKVQQLTFKSMHPDDPRAAANWALICGVEISDRMNLLVSGAHGQELSGDYFVEGISYDIRPLHTTLDLGYPWVEMTLDVSPRLYWADDPWEEFT